MTPRARRSATRAEKLGPRFQGMGLYGTVRSGRVQAGLKDIGTPSDIRDRIHLSLVIPSHAPRQDVTHCIYVLFGVGGPMASLPASKGRFRSSGLLRGVPLLLLGRKLTFSLRRSRWTRLRGEAGRPGSTRSCRLGQRQLRVALVALRFL